LEDLSMGLNLFALLGLRRRSSARPSAPTYFRPSLDGLEERVVPSASPALAPALFAPAAHHAAAAHVPISITGVSVQNGQLVASGLAGITPFTAPVTPSAVPNPADPSVPILDLHLDAIHLDVLGLKVDTSNICVDVIAHPGQGLLGDLLGGLANALNTDPTGGLAGFLNGLTGRQLNTLTNGLTNLLNRSVFGPLSRSAAALDPAATNILHLQLGPVDLNLLGLEVSVDNCAGGPVTVDVSAQPGPGNLLGNLLSDIVHLLDQTPHIPALDHIFSDIGRIIDRLL
jgi:hypothetical protein